MTLSDARDRTRRPRGSAGRRRDLPAHPRTTVRGIDEDAYWEYLGSSAHAGYQQSPQWGRARSGDWDPELVGWYDLDDRLVGVALLRSRSLPVVHRRFAMMAQGPVIDWEHGDLPDLLAALEAYARGRGIFALVVVPSLALRAWGPTAVKAALADPEVTKWSQVTSDREDPVGHRAVQALAAAGWHRLPQDGMLDASQPLFTFWIPLGGRTEEEVLAGMTRAWRKNIRKAEREGVVVIDGTREDLPTVQRLYAETAARQGFSAQPLEYFESMWDALAGDQPGTFHLHLALHEGDVLAANGTARAGGHAQGVFAARGDLRRQLKAANALYAEIIHGAIAEGADQLDIGGVAETLEADGPEAGLLVFKADMGGEVREGIGGWELVLSPLLHAGFTRLLPLYGRIRHLADAGLRRRGAHTTPAAG
ncbi:peptidoglycan bridge formation glycyltransferase FemA/FemB family protein [Brachybacterium sp. sponge]|uniref:lipid II:glycine glycyltransferase FemX n=1 Tax=Brachybacterium sp. sponge TaxID=1775432 RepID=UPI000AEA9068|nr:peptidoglycan bridge formation glycyltransferase FemA/FemB family protein [Brachybacterium sp. sponge]